MCLVLLFAPAPPEQSRILTQLTVFQNMALALAAAFAGYALHEHQERTRAIEERAVAAERSRDAEARRRVEAERVSIAREVHDIVARVARIEQAAGIPEGETKLWCNIESHIGVLNAREIAEADPRVVVLALGAEDFTASMHARRTKAGWEIFYARNAVLMACRAAGKGCVDAVFSDINDAEGLQADAEITKTLGFDGKTVVHPRQIDTVNALFTPTQKEINHAIRVLDAIEEGKKRNKGAVTLDGSMLDMPMVIRAENVIALARAAGIKIGGKYDER